MSFVGSRSCLGPVVLHQNFETPRKPILGRALGKQTARAYRRAIFVTFRVLQINFCVSRASCRHVNSLLHVRQSRLIRYQLNWNRTEVNIFMALAMKMECVGLPMQWPMAMPANSIGRWQNLMNFLRGLFCFRCILHAWGFLVKVPLKKYPL